MRKKRNLLLLSLAGLEIRKLFCYKLYPFTLVLTFAVVLVTFLYVRLAPEDRENGFYCLAACLYWGATFSSLFIILLSSQLFSGEMSMGSMKNLLLCPIRRADLFLAKVLGLLFLTLSFLMLFGGLSLLAGSICGFAALPSSAPPREAVLHQAWTSSLLVFFPLLATGAMGLAVSASIDNAPLSMAISVLLYIPLFLASHFFQGRSFGVFLFPGYLEKILGDFCEITQGYTGMAGHQAQILPYLAALVPLLFSAVLLLLAALLFNKKNILI